MPPTQATSTEELTEQAARLRLAINRMARRLRQEANTDLGPASITTERGVRTATVSITPASARCCSWTATASMMPNRSRFS